MLPRLAKLKAWLAKKFWDFEGDLDSLYDDVFGKDEATETAKDKQEEGE